MRVAPLGTLQGQADADFASNQRPPGRCLAPIETTTFASHFPVRLVPGTYRAGRELGFASKQRPPQAVPGTLKRFRSD